MRSQGRSVLVSLHCAGVLDSSHQIGPPVRNAGEGLNVLIADKHIRMYMRMRNSIAELHCPIHVLPRGSSKNLLRFLSGIPADKKRKSDDCLQTWQESEFP